MAHRTNTPTSRRRFLRTSGAALALIPLVNVSGCSDGGSAPAPEASGGTGGSTPSEAPAPAGTPSAAPEQAAPAAPEPAAGGAAPAADLVRLEESDGTARALGYRHDATQVDAGKYGRYEAGQMCGNCNLYQGDSGESGWGACSIFPGKLVNAQGWCSAYVPGA